MLQVLKQIQNLHSQLGEVKLSCSNIFQSNNQTASVLSEKQPKPESFQL